MVWILLYTSLNGTRGLLIHLLGFWWIHRARGVVPSITFVRPFWMTSKNTLSDGTLLFGHSSYNICNLHTVKFLRRKEMWTCSRHHISTCKLDISFDISSPYTPRTSCIMLCMMQALAGTLLLFIMICVSRAQRHLKKK